MDDDSCSRSSESGSGNHPTSSGIRVVTKWWQSGYLVTVERVQAVVEWKGARSDQTVEVFRDWGIPMLVESVQATQEVL